MVRPAGRVLLVLLLVVVMAADTNTVQDGRADVACPVLSDAIYSWWLHPVAVGDGDHTWVGSIGEGDFGGAEEPLNRVSRISCSTGEVTAATLEGLSGPDDHNGVAIALDPTQDQLIAFYARHGNDAFVRYQFVDRSSVLAGSLQTLSFTDTVTYVQLLRHAGTLWVITRAGGADNGRWEFRSTSDWGQTWTDAATLVDHSGAGPFYVSARPDPSNPRIVHLFTEERVGWTVGYAQLDLGTGQITLSDGTVIGDLGAAGGPALVPSDFETVAAAPAEQRLRLLDGGVVDGRPAVAYALFPDTGTAGGSYLTARRSASGWQSQGVLVASGDPFQPHARRYLGGVVFGTDDQLWTSREDAGEWVVEQWSWTGSGWTLDFEVDRSTTITVRPYAVWLPATGQARLVYQRIGSYPASDTGDYHDANIVTTDPQPPTPPPDPEPEPVAVAQIRRRLTWLGVHAVTGQIIAELPDVRGSVGRLLSAYSSHELVLPAPLAGPGHVPHQLLEQATAEVDTAIVAVVNDIPVWMGWVLLRRRGTGAEWRLGTVTPEAYLRKRTIADHTFTDVDRALVAAALVADAGALAGVGSGLGFTVEVQPTGELMSATFLATDRRPVYDGLRELAAGGIEFTVDLDWTDTTRTAVRKILRIRPRIGRAAAGPPPLFETAASPAFDSLAGSEATYELTEDSTDGRYANHVVAIAPGEGEDQPASAPAVDTAALAGGSPIVEHVVGVSSADTSQAALDAAAMAELSRLKRGAELWDLSIRLDAYPRLGVDVQLGDDVQWALKGHGHPAGVTGSGRVIGYQVDEQAGRWQPILLDPQQGVVTG